MYPVPYLIFSCIKDETVYYSIAQSFANAINNRQKGQIAVDTTTSLGAHNVLANPKLLGTFKYKDSDYDLNEVYCKIDDFFKKT